MIHFIFAPRPSLYIYRIPVIPSVVEGSPGLVNALSYQQQEPIWIAVSVSQVGTVP